MKYNSSKALGEEHNTFACLWVKYPEGWKQNALDRNE